MIAVGSDKEDMEQLYEEVEQAAIFFSPYAMPHENNSPIYICRRPKHTLKEVWPSVKEFM